MLDLNTFALVKEHAPALLDDLVDRYESEKDRFRRRFVADAQEKLLIACPLLTAKDAKRIAKQLLPE